MAVDGGRPPTTLVFRIAAEYKNLGWRPGLRNLLCVRSLVGDWGRLEPLTTKAGKLYPTRI